MRTFPPASFAPGAAPARLRAGPACAAEHPPWPADRHP